VNGSRVVRAVLVWLALGLVAWVLTPTVRFFVTALLGGALIGLLGEPQWPRFRRSVALAAGFGLVWAAGRPGAVPILLAHPGLLGALLGLGALADLALHPAEDDAVTLGAFGIPGFVLGVALTLGSGALNRPETKDAILLQADRALGGLPSYAMGGAFAAHPALAAFSWVAYVMLAVEAALVVLVAIRRGLPDMHPRRILFACGAAGLAALLGYWACPGTGPRYAFPGFPAARPGPLALAGIAVSPEFPRNAMPSLHFAWALMLHRAAFPVRWLRYMTLAWLAGIGAATLGTGEHYLIDLVVAVPFAAAIETGLVRSWQRMLAASALTAAWVVFLGNDGGLPPALAWPAVAGTLALGVWALPRAPYGAPRTLAQAT